MKIRMFFLTLLLSFMLIGCSTNSTISETSIANGTTAQKEYEQLKPPELIIQIGDSTVRPTLGTYSWSRKYKNGTTQGVEADSESPPNIVKNHEPYIVNEEDLVNLVFDVPPKEYEIREWDIDTYIKTYKELDLSIHEGIKVFEVLAYWGQGTASYAFLLEIN